jgi:1,4-dihydroxy-2-naphthoate polyprenyltransferase
LLSLVSGVGLLWIALPALFSLKGLLYLITGVLGIGAAINYTVGRNPYGYKGWGDFFVFVFFGLVGVYGSYYLHAGVFRWEVLLLASAVGLLSAAVLNVNNMRDEVSDRASRKLSMVVMWGHRFGVIYHICLVLLAWFALVWFVAINHVSVFNWMFVLTLPLFVVHLQKVLTTVELRLLDPELKRLAIATFLTVLLIIVGWLL